jgi:hypothetical protein
LNCNNKPLFFTVVSKLLLKIKQNFSSFIVQFYDSRITKKKLYIILSYNNEVSDGFSHQGDVEEQMRLAVTGDVEGVVGLVREFGEVVKLQVQKSLIMIKTLRTTCHLSNLLDFQVCIWT